MIEGTLLLILGLVLEHRIKFEKYVSKMNIILNDCPIIKEKNISLEG